MINYYISDFESAQKLALYCNKFDVDFDIISGRQIIDGKSLLGVFSLVGKHVSIDVLSDDDEVKKRFEDGLQDLD